MFEIKQKTKNKKNNNKKKTFHFKSYLFFYIFWFNRVILF